MTETSKGLENTKHRIDSSDENKQTSENLTSMLDTIKKGNVPKEKMEHIFNYVLKLAEIEGKYRTQKEDIKKGVRIFIEASLGNTLNKHLGEFNVSKFDVDGQKGWDREEEKNFGKAIQESVGKIIILGGLEKFSHMKAIKNDPQLGILSGMGKGTKEGANSSWDGTKAVFVGTGEFIGVGAAKLVHEGGDSFIQYTEEKTKVIRDVVNIAGEAIAITAFEAVNGDQSVIQGAVDYWKGKGVEFGKLPAGKQAELLTSFATQIAIGIVGAKGLGAASKTATLGKTMEFTSKIGKTLGKVGSGIAIAGVEVTGVDSGAMNPKTVSIKQKEEKKEKIQKKDSIPEQREGVKSSEKNDSTAVSNNSIIPQKKDKHTSRFHKKINTPEENTVKVREGENGKVIRHSPEEYSRAYKGGLKTLGTLLADVKDYQVLSSNAMFAQFKDYKFLPDDFDVAIMDKDFPEIYMKLQDAQGKGEIRGLTVKSIDNSHLTHIKDLVTQEKFLKTGNLQIIFHIDTPEGIPFEVEMFAEGLGHGHTQPGYIPRTGNHNMMIDDVEIKLASPEATADLYTLNFIKEILNNDIEKHGKKTKDAARVESLIRHLQETGDKDPNAILTRMYEVEARYRDHAGGNLSPVLNDIFGEIPRVKEILDDIIGKYEVNKAKQQFGSKIEGSLPEFQEFTETWKMNKGEMHSFYRELGDKKNASLERMETIRAQLDDYEIDMQKVLNVSLNNEDFAYFYEMTIVKEKYLNPIRKLISNQESKKR